MNASAYDFSGLDSIMNRYSPDAPGAAIIIAQGDSILYERYAGLADMSERTPIGPDTRFCIASCSKQFTVAALLRQVSGYRGSMPLLDTPLSRFFDYEQPFWNDITLRNLANHTSGIPDSRPRTDRNWCVFADEAQSLDYLPSVESTTFGPGEYYDYLNPSFILIANVVEQLTGKDFYKYMTDSIFTPAGMTHTYYFDPGHDGPGQSHAYVPDGDGQWKEYDYGEETFYATRPDGGIYSTARDLLAWENALRDATVLDASLRDLAYRPSVSVTDSPLCDYQRRPDTWYGLGWFIDHPANQPKKVYHTGDNGGYQAYLAKYPEEDIKIIVLENRNDFDRWEFATAIDIIMGVRK
ncbi:MAG: beta-lactamase family protein [Muribaculaceae bacterium]